MGRISTTWQFALCSAILAVCSSVAAQSTLGMADVKALISGNTVFTVNVATGRTYSLYFDASGEVQLQREDAGVFSGVWSVRADGTHCVSFNDETCGMIEKNADGTYTRVVAGAPPFKWTKISPGRTF